MSSTFWAYCLNHQPAIDIGGEWQNEDEAHAAVEASRLPGAVVHGELTLHRLCEVVLVRSSGAPCDLGCIDGRTHGHLDPRWYDIEWLRVAWAIRNEDNPYRVDAVLERVFGANTCFSHERMTKLYHVFDWVVK